MFVKGKSGNPAGKPRGTKSKFTRSAKEAFSFAFDEIGGKKALAEWGRLNQTDFYKLFSKLIPTDVTTDGEPLKLNLYLPAKESDS